MAHSDSGFLDAFPEWLRSLSDDSLKVCAALRDTSIASGARVSLVGALNYLFKSLDLIPDGIEDLGFIDDAFVFRVAAAQAVAEDPAVADKDASGTIKRLSGEADVVRSFLSDDYARLDKFVRSLRKSAVRGRAPEQVVADSEMCEALILDVEGWAGSFEAPAFGREEKNLVKLRSFLGAKLPS